MEFWWERTDKAAGDNGADGSTADAAADGAPVSCKGVYTNKYISIQIDIPTGLADHTFAAARPCLAAPLLFTATAHALSGEAAIWAAGANLPIMAGSK